MITVTTCKWLEADLLVLLKVPFVLGGEFVLDNLYLAVAVEGMRFRADIASQIKELPDGAQIRLNIDS
jgi:hypothetical protein